jgi:hypothetical protein
MSFWNRVELARTAFLQGRTLMSNHDFLLAIGVSEEIAPMAVILRAAIADRCQVDVSMLKPSDECVVLEKIMGKGHLAFIGDMAYGIWGDWEFVDSLTCVTGDRSLFRYILKHAHDIELPQFGSGGRNPPSSLPIQPKSLGEWILAVAPIILKCAAKCGAESAMNIEKVGSNLIR